MRLIDTHSHVYEDDFDEDRNLVISRLKERGVCKVFLPNIDSASIPKMLDLENLDPSLFRAMIGLHPTSVAENWKTELDIEAAHLQKRKFCAIGEIGIDLYWDRTFIDEQISVFETQVDWAVTHDLPIVIHARKSFEEITHSLRKFDKNKLRGIFHSFSGSIEMANDIFKLGDFYLGLNGVITFKNAGVAKTISELPLTKLVLETDSPYLTPVPFRGTRNESSYVYYVAEKLSQIKECTIDSVAEATTANAEQLFGEK